MADRMSPETRRAVTSAGGRARIDKADPDEMLRTRQAAARATNSPVALARRIVKAWPTLDRTDQLEVLAVLDDIQPRDRTRPLRKRP